MRVQTHPKSAARKETICSCETWCCADTGRDELRQVCRHLGPDEQPPHVQRDDSLQHLTQIQCRLIADRLLKLGNVRDPPVHVLEPSLIRLVVRDALNLGWAVYHLLDQYGELVDRDVLRVADVEYFAV